MNLTLRTLRRGVQRSLTFGADLGRREAQKLHGCAADDLKGVSRDFFWTGYSVAALQTWGLAFGSEV
jgi:hypothetical protein